MSEYVYRRTEPGLWTVGFFWPDGNWESESDHGVKERAAQRTAYLNGGASDLLAERDKLAAEVEEDTGVMKVLRRRVEAAEAERDKLAQRVKVLEEALSWIAIVNACDYEYQQVARAALEEKSCPSQNPGWM